MAVFKKKKLTMQHSFTTHPVRFLLIVATFAIDYNRHLRNGNLSIKIDCCI